MKKHRQFIFTFLTLFVLGGCATIPTGPSVMVLPPPGKPFEQFQADDAICRQWAAQQTGLSNQATVNKNTTDSALVGTALGAALGTAIGAASGQGAEGAAIGAATGLIVGTASGSSAGQAYGWEVQRRYDNAYQQCMYAKGNQIPANAVMNTVPRHRSRRMYPPPPPGYNYVPPDYTPPPPATPPPTQ